MKLKQDVPPVPLVGSELHPDLLSINALNPWAMHNSSPRAVMFSSSHIAQSLVIDGATPRSCMTGAEVEFGKTTFKHRFPCDASIIKTIPKFRQTLAANSISEDLNPSTLVIYENLDTKEVGILELVKYSTAIDNKHQHFGFRYKFSPDADRLYPDAKFRAGTILGDSPAVDGFSGNDSYNYGVETNVAFMSIPGIIEDGVVISESYRNKIASKGYEKRVVNWGKKYYPLNLYGDRDHYKPFPDIGEQIRDDGLLFALRPYDDLLGPVEMDPDSLTKPIEGFDKLVYAVKGATVIDININHDTTDKVPPTPVGMEVQTMKYYQQQYRYYREILDVYQELYRVRRDALAISKEFSRLIVEAMNYVGFEDNPVTKHFRRKDPLPKRRVQQLYRRSDIDDWRVEVAFEYPVVPNIGNKITGCHGDRTKVTGCGFVRYTCEK